MLGYLDKNKQILVAFGHQHLGLTAGAKTGRIVSDLIIGNDIKLNMSNYKTKSIYELNKFGGDNEKLENFFVFIYIYKFFFIWNSSC